MVGKGEFSKDGGPWEPDLALTYTRATSSEPPQQNAMR